MQIPERVFYSRAEDKSFIWINNIAGIYEKKIGVNDKILHVRRNEVKTDLTYWGYALRKVPFAQTSNFTVVVPKESLWEI